MVLVKKRVTSKSSYIQTVAQEWTRDVLALAPKITKVDIYMPSVISLSAQEVK